MSTIDIAALVLIVFGAVHGCIRGLSGELAHVLSVLAAFVFGLWIHPPFAAWILAHTRLSERPAQALAFAGAVLCALIVMFCLRFVVGRVMKVVIEPPFDRIGGVLAGFVRSCVIVVILFILLNMWPNEYLNRTFGEESVIGSLVRSRMSAYPSVEDDQERDEHGTPTDEGKGS